MTVDLFQLWLPILLGGLFCWILSAIFHMLIKHHNADYKQLKNESEVADVLGGQNLSPGLYSMPYCSDMKDMGSQEMLDKFNKGPVAMVSIFANGMPPMGKLLLQQLLYYIFVCVLIAYISTLSLTVDSGFQDIFRVLMTAGFLAFGAGVIPFSIWYGHPWSNCLRFLVDALFYAAVVAATFAWLWPSAS